MHTPTAGKISGSNGEKRTLLWFLAARNPIVMHFQLNVIIWCYHVMLSSGMITPPLLFFLQTSLTPEKCFYASRERYCTLGR
jgi:hypothetical protein